MTGLHSYTLLSADQLPADEPKGLVEGVLPAKGLAILFGPSGSGKSFLTLDMGMCISAGMSWHGKETQQGNVLWVLAEGSSAFRKRVEGWQQWYAVPELPNCRFLLDAPDILKGGLGAVQKACIQGDFRPSLVIIDTVKRTLIGEESASKDVGAWCQACVTTFPDACVIGVHHTGHEGTRARGSSAWRDHADTMFMIEQPTQGQVSFVCEKQRDWDDTLKMQLKLEKLDLVPAPDGTPRSTLVVTMQGETRASLSEMVPDLDAARAVVLQTFVAGRPGMSFTQVARLVNGPGGPFQGLGDFTINQWMGMVWKGSRD